MQQFGTTRYILENNRFRGQNKNSRNKQAYDRFGARGNCTCSRVNTQTNLYYCAGRLNWTIAAALPNFQSLLAHLICYSKATRLGSFEILNLLFFVCKQATEGQVGALFRVKHLQPCGMFGNCRMLHFDRTRPGHVLRMWLCKLCIFAMLFNIFNKTVFEQILIPKIELGQWQQIYCYSYSHCTVYVKVQRRTVKWGRCYYKKDLIE